MKCYTAYTLSTRYAYKKCIYHLKENSQKMTDIITKLETMIQSIGQLGGQTEEPQSSSELSISLGGKCPPERKPKTQDGKDVCPHTHPHLFTSGQTLLKENCCYRTKSPPQYIRTPIVWVIEKKDKTQKPFSSNFQKKVEAAYQAWKISGKGEEKRVYKYSHRNQAREIDFARKAWIKHSKDGIETLPLLRIKRGDVRSKSLALPSRKSPQMNIEPVEDIPVEDNPVEDNPVEDNSMEDIPVEDNPVEDIPVEDTPVEDNPVEDNPVGSFETISPKLVAKSLVKLETTVADKISKKEEKTKKLTESLKLLKNTVDNIIQEEKIDIKEEVDIEVDILDPRKAIQASGEISARIDKNGDVVDTLYYTNRYGTTYDEFMKYINHEFAVVNGIYNKIPDEYKNQCTNNTQEMSVTQKFIPLYLDPMSPYKGLLMYHQVGAGKTRIALHTMAKYYNFSKKHPETESPKLIWVTTRELVKDMQERYTEFKWFWDEPTSPFNTGETSWRGKKPIYLFSFKEFTNALKGKNGFAKKHLWKKNTSKAYKINTATGDWEDTSPFDPLENTFIVFDEIHKFYESPYSVNRLVEKAVFDSYKKSKLNGKPSTKLLLLTGTPIPTIGLRHTGPPISQTSISVYDIPFIVFRMLNLLIDNPGKRLPGTRTQFISVFGRDPVDMSQESIIRFKDLAKGLISYFNPTFQYNIFAKRIVRAEVIATASDSVIKRIQEDCTNPKISENALGLSPEKGRCLWWVSNWAGTKDYSWPPKSWKIGWRMNLEDFDYQDVLSKLPELSPKTFKLIENIKFLDNQDRERYGKTYKHYIFSNLPPSKGSAVVNAGLQASGFKYIRAEKRLRDLGLSSVLSQRDMNELNISQPTIVGNLKEEDQHSSNNFFFLEQFLHSNEKHITKLAFSDHRLNNYGQIARIIVIDKDYKEGINLMDVKYIHILEPQLTRTDEEQIVGRALRKCGHSGLPFNEWNYSVFIYDIEIPNFILDARDTGFSKISNEVIKNIIDPIILQDKNIITQMLQDVAVDKYINNPDNAAFIEQKIQKKKIQPKSNLFKPYTALQLETVSLSNKKVGSKRISSKDMKESVEEISRTNRDSINIDDGNNVEKQGWETSITIENSSMFDEKLRNLFLVSYFKFTPQNVFQKRYIEMFTEPFVTSIDSAPNLKEKLKGFNYRSDIVFYFKNSGIVYIPIFNNDVQILKNRSTKRYLNNLRDNMKCILIYSTKGIDSFGILLRDSTGVVKEIGPVKSKKQYLRNVSAKLNTLNLDLFAL